MKETVKINLNQQLFDLDSDAYNTLKTYLDSLHNIFSQSPDESEEILQDIEQRIAELLNGKLSATKQVVTLADIEEVIGLLGTAEDFAMDSENLDDTSESSQENQEQTFQEQGHRNQRRFFRDVENNIIGGVCGGLGSYFNVDPVWIRLALLLLFFLKGFGLLIYLILWAVVPAARTTAQKLQMKGRSVTVENIQDSVKSEFSKVKDKWNKYRKSDRYRDTQHASTDIIQNLGRVFIVIAKIILILIGIGFLIGFLVLIIGFISGVATGGPFSNWHWPQYHIWSDFYPAFHSNSLFGIAVLLVILLPIIGLFIGLLRLILGVRSRNSVLAAFGWTIWALALVFVIIVIVSGNEIISYPYESSGDKHLNVPPDKVLLIDVDRDQRIRRNWSHYHVFGREIIHNKHADECFVRPRLSIEQGSQTMPYLIIEQQAIIPDFDDDDEFFEHSYSWKLQDTLLIFDEFFILEEEDIWRWPGMKIRIFIPEGQRFQLSRNAEVLTEDLEYESFSGHSLYNRELRMENDHIIAQ